MGGSSEEISPTGSSSGSQTALLASGRGPAGKAGRCAFFTCAHLDLCKIHVGARETQRGVVCSVVWCGVVQCSVVWCSVVWCGVEWCSVVWCGVV